MFTIDIKTGSSLYELRNRTRDGPISEFQLRYDNPYEIVVSNVDAIMISYINGVVQPTHFYYLLLLLFI